MLLRLGVAAALLVMWSCSGDGDGGASEPVSPAKESPAKIPDAPGGDTGEAAPKAADTQAAAPAAAPVSAPEKTMPTEGSVEKSVPGGGQEMVVKSAKLHVRQGPGVDHPIVRTLHRGEKVAPVGCEKHWCKLADGEFVAQKFLKKAP